MYIDFNPKTEGNIEPRTTAISNTNVAEQPIIHSQAASQSWISTKFSISEYRNCKDNDPKPKIHTWASFCDEFRVHKTLATKDGPAWTPAQFTEAGTRKNENVVHLTMAVIDVDNGTALDTVLQRIEGYAYLAHSSYSHSLETPKYRVILPLESPVALTDWPQAWARINQLVGECNDPATKDPARLYYKPAHPKGTDTHFARIGEGRRLDVNALPKLAAQGTEHPLTFQSKVSYQRIQEIEGIESNGADLNFEQGLKEVVNRCAFMQFASAPENQQAVSEPLWMSMLSNACRFENSEAWIHAASDNHSGYSEEQTDVRIERYRNGSAPITCQRIRELGFQHCPSGGCNLSSGVATKSPAGLGGWIFHPQLTGTETAIDQIPDTYQVDTFHVKPHGVFGERKDAEGNITNFKICSRIDVVALTRDEESSNWGLELRFKDPDNVQKSWAMPKELLASAGDSYRASLLKMGASIEPAKNAKEALAAYLTAAKPEGRALSARQPGWFKERFVLPDAVYGRGDERLVFQTSDPDEMKRFSQKGTLQSWQQNVATPCQGNSRAVASICIGLAPPLLRLLGEDNGGFHLRGNSSIGKSVCLYLGSSVWGGNALIRTWNMTVNGLEGVATMHNDVLLPLDELGQANGKDAGEAAYMLGNGQGKGRANKDGDARTAKRWRNLVLSSGEKSMADLMAEAGLTAMAGQEVRMVEIAADAGAGLGVFENIHGAKSSQAFAEALKQAVADHHGHAGRAFVELLANPDLQSGLTDKVKALMQRFVSTYVPASATGQVGRVGNRFGLVAAAGELCIELGILPWPEGEAFDACSKCFLAWIDLRGGIGNHEAEQAIAKVKRFIEVHGESRFTPITEGIDNNAMGKTINRAGFRKVVPGGSGGDGTEYYILPEVYKSDICGGLNPRYVTSVLIDKGYLATDRRDNPQIEMRLPGIGKKRVYHLKAEFMSDGVSLSENCETVVRQSEISKPVTKYKV